MLKRLFASLALAACASSCTSPPVRHDGIEVVPRRDHRHSAYCGHYHHENSWYYVQGHKHGVKCGHYLVNGEWVIER